MGNKLFKNYGVDIAREINKIIGPSVLPATLTKTTPGTRTGGQLTGGTNPTTTSYPCRGFLDSQEIEAKQGGLEVSGRLVAVLIGDSIAGGTVTPEPGDRILIEGVQYFIPDDGRIDRDPDKATYTCDVRRR